MPNRLRRFYGAGYLHFVTFSCYQRLPFLRTKRSRDLLAKVLEQTRRRYGFVVAGYVIMPEHVHLLIGEPERGNPSVVMQVLKQRFARQWSRAPKHSSQGWLWEDERTQVWQRRFYDFVVWRVLVDEKIAAKLKMRAA